MEPTDSKRLRFAVVEGDRDALEREAVRIACRATTGELGHIIEQLKPRGRLHAVPEHAFDEGNQHDVPARASEETPPSA